MRVTGRKIQAPGQNGCGKSRSGKMDAIAPGFMLNSDLETVGKNGVSRQHQQCQGDLVAEKSEVAHAASNRQKSEAGVGAPDYRENCPCQHLELGSYLQVAALCGFVTMIFERARGQKQQIEGRRNRD